MGCDGSMCSASDELLECEEQRKRAEETLAKLVDARGKDAVKSLETQIAEWKAFHKIIKTYEEGSDDCGK